jgi:hypothetical protein
MDAFCSICGHGHDIRSPGIRKIWGTDTWECADESACFCRLAAQHLERDSTPELIEAMQRALDGVWAMLEATGE